MPIYNGNNTQNNEISVDFDKREVKFKPISEYRRFESAISFFSHFSLLSIVLILLSVWIWIFINFFNFIFQSKISAYLIYAVCMSGFTGMMFFALIWTIILFSVKKWRYEYFAKFQAELFRYIQILIFIQIIEKETILPAKIKKNKYSFEFGNISLDYRATEDFAKHLHKIKIKHRKNNQWKCTFEFRDKIEAGLLDLKYI